MKDLGESPKLTLTMVRTIKEMGAPFLKALKLSDKFNKNVSLVPLIEALKSSTLPSLKWLQFRKGRRDLFPLHYKKLAVHPKEDDPNLCFSALPGRVSWLE